MARLVTRSLAIIVAGLFALFALTEVLVRTLGAVDFPLYSTPGDIGYIPAPNQRGEFLNRNRWAFNDRSMGVAESFTPGGVLLIGDSVVYGGNHLDQPEKLGPQLEQKLGMDVWPVSAGSWSIANELLWLEQNNDVVSELAAIVVVLGSGDFSAPSRWRSELTQPTRRPLSALLYLMRKYGIARILPSRPATPASQDWPWRERLGRFAASAGIPVLVALWPERSGSAFPNLSDVPLIVPLPIADDPRWSSHLYRDGIHPNPRGNRVIAAILADAMRTIAPLPAPPSAPQSLP